MRCDPPCGMLRPVQMARCAASHLCCVPCRWRAVLRRCAATRADGALCCVAVLRPVQMARYAASRANGALCCVTSGARVTISGEFLYISAVSRYSRTVNLPHRSDRHTYTTYSTVSGYRDSPDVARVSNLRVTDLTYL